MTESNNHSPDAKAWKCLTPTKINLSVHLCKKEGLGCLMTKGLVWFCTSRFTEQGAENFPLVTSHNLLLLSYLCNMKIRKKCNHLIVVTTIQPSSGQTRGIRQREMLRAFIYSFSCSNIVCNLCFMSLSFICNDEKKIIPGCV